ncbi:ferredoxin reductase family protein [Aerolutibacter ruishenii]|uniref:Putative ferric reductase n=1 Tax=Aerolutibacter ruishenii TaxID=686800 RepID=A0A562M0N2_9GAMM|nr:ferredoxin reductase family protein [Lysobacter ruishenii]TWI13403.1 putative ferric reductase [Lysobacter ruishenii]
MTLKSWHVITALVVASAVLVAMELPADTRLGTAALSLSSGVAAFTLMAAASVLGARWSWVESRFGGLDRVYQVHKWMGVWALGLASIHLVFKAGMPGWDTASILALSGGWTRFLRQFSFVGLMFIVVLALNRNIPYGQWRLWHKLSGPLFVVVVLHWLSFKQPLALASPAGAWLLAWSLLGVVAAFYKLLLYPHVASHAEYRVVDQHRNQSGLHLQLEPVGRGLDFTPGQFGFMRMEEEGLREPHPFTIASGGDAGRVDFVIRPLGDFTRKLLAEAKVGMRATVYAPFGRFDRNRTARREVWIGGGVGISPFIAWLQDASANGFDKVTLFYFYTPGREFPDVSVLEAMARERGAELVPVRSGASDPAFVQRFAEICRSGDPAGVDVAFCGPKGLMAQVRARMQDNGVPAANLRYEHFEFR